MLQWHDERLMHYPASVAITWETTFVQLKDAEQRLLQMLAWLAARADPALPVRRRFAEKGDPRPSRGASPAWRPSPWRGSRQTGDTVVIHRLVQEVARGRGDEAARQDALRIALEAVNSVVPEESDNVHSWPVWTPLATHVAAVTAHAAAAVIAEPTSRLMNDLGLYLMARGQFAEAERLQLAALKIAESHYGPGHLVVGIRLSCLAWLLKTTNRLAEAEPLMRGALSIHEASYGRDHPSTARHLNNLAQLLHDTDRLVEAETLMRRVLSIDERFYGKDHPHVARDLNNLAQLLQDTNRLVEAEPLMRRALSIDERFYGPAHPSVARDLNNLAQLLRDTNRLAEAETLMRRALSIDEGSYGPDHPEVAVCLANLAAS